MKTKKTKKSLGLHWRNKVEQYSLKSEINNKVGKKNQRPNWPCRRIFINKALNSKWSPELVEKTRILDKVYLESKRVFQNSKSGDTEFEKVRDIKGLGRYYNTSLPLIPNIRHLSVQEKCHDVFLNLFGIKSRKCESDGNLVILRSGPNKRANRYLKYQYSRLMNQLCAYKVLIDPEKNQWAYKWFYNALEGRFVEEPYVDILYDDLIRKKDQRIKKYRYPPVKETERPLEIIRAKFTVLSLKDAYDLINSEGLKEWSFLTEMRSLNYSKKIVIRFPIKYYVPNNKLGINKKTFSQRKYNSQIKKFWILRTELLKKSKVFRIALINMLWGEERVFSSVDMNKLKTWINGFVELCLKWSQNPTIYRVWIETNEKWRPLGVAPRKWRLVMKAEQIFLDIFVRGSWDKNQHGYITGKGVNTAWKEILSMNALKVYENIFEYDFRGFFNNIDLKTLGELLYKMGMPKQEIGRYLNLVGCEIKQPNYEDLKKISSDTFSKYEYIHLYRKNFRWKGVPQGSGISPILSVLALTSMNQKLKKYGIWGIKYADDGLFFSNSKKNPLEILSRNKKITGVSFNLDKSGWVKFEGKWIKSLKFLGLTYDPFDDVLRASTRKNSNLNLFLTNFIKVTKKPRDKTPDVMNMKNVIKEIKTRVIWKDGLILKKDEVFGKKTEKIDMSEIKNQMGKYKEKGLENQISPSYHKNDETIYAIDKILMEKEGLEEIKPWLTVKPIRWFGKKEVESYWLKKCHDENSYIKKTNKKNKEIKNQEILMKLMDMKRTFQKPYFVLKKEENGEIYAMFEKVLIFPELKKTEWKLNENMQIITGVNWTKDKMKEYEYGLWYKIDKSDLPYESVKHNEDIYVSVLDYRNTWNKSSFNSLIARLFAGSFDLGGINQDFSKPVEKDSLLGGFIKLMGKSKIKNIVNQNHINFANQSSIGCHLLQKILDDKKLSDACGFKSEEKYKTKTLKIASHWREVYKKIVNRLKNKRCGTIMQTRIKIDEILFQELAKLGEKEQFSPELYKAIHMCPEIVFNGPFDPCYNLQKDRNIKLPKNITKVLRDKYLSPGMIRIVKEKIKNNKTIFKRKTQFMKEIERKIWKTIGEEGMNKQVLLNQFFGNQDRFKINQELLEFYKDSQGGIPYSIYGWANSFYDARENELGYIEKPKNSKETI